MTSEKKSACLTLAQNSSLARVDQSYQDPTHVSERDYVRLNVCSSSIKINIVQFISADASQARG
ncbi:MAG: hypothetical protein GY820_07615 [Gammaproteobacteria bacterium]|nr:hypothetical protein [Gammaproteobacteria bacterium]